MVRRKLTKNLIINGLFKTETIAVNKTFQLKLINFSSLYRANKLRIIIRFQVPLKLQFICYCIPKNRLQISIFITLFRAGHLRVDNRLFLRPTLFVYNTYELQSRLCYVKDVKTICAYHRLVFQLVHI